MKILVRPCPLDAAALATAARPHCPAVSGIVSASTAGGSQALNLSVNVRLVMFAASLEQNCDEDRDRVLRSLVFFVCGLATIAVTVVIGIVVASGHLASGEQLSRNLAWGAVLTFGLPYLACVVPAIFLAFINRCLPLALGLCALLPPVAYLVFLYA